MYIGFFPAKIYENLLKTKLFLTALSRVKFLTVYSPKLLDTANNKLSIYLKICLNCKLNNIYR